MVEKKAKTVTNEATPDAKASGRGLTKFREGLVVSNKMAKTVVVAVERQVRHAMYGKYIRKTSKYYAHDEKGTCGVGDRVRIQETRPLSKMKRWRVTEVVRKADIAG